MCVPGYKGCPALLLHAGTLVFRGCTEYSVRSIACVNVQILRVVSVAASTQVDHWATLRNSGQPRLVGQPRLGAEARQQVGQGLQGLRPSHRARAIRVRNSVPIEAGCSRTAPTRDDIACGCKSEANSSRPTTGRQSSPVGAILGWSFYARTHSLLRQNPCFCASQLPLDEFSAYLTSSAFLAHPLH